MRITQYPMKPGNWSLRLKPDTPEEILAKLRIKDSRTNFAGLGTIIVTPNRMDTWVGLPAILSRSCYVGVYLTREDRLTLSGQGLEWWIDHPDDATYNSITGVHANFAAAMTSLRNLLGDPTITAGTIHAVPGTMEIDPTATDYSEIVDQQDAGDNFKRVMANFSAEWRINPANLALDAGLITDLYGTDPAAYFHPNARGPEPGVAVLSGRSRPRESVEGYRELVRIYGYTKPVPMFPTDPVLADQFVQRASPIHFAAPWAVYSSEVGLREMLYDSTVYGSNAELLAVAQGILDAIPEIEVSAMLDVVNYDPSLMLAGKWVGIFDLLNDLYDPTAAGVWIGGEYCPPLTSRVVGLDYVVPENAGVCLLTSDGDKASTSLRDLHDISAWVDHDSGDPGSATITCGALEPSWVTAVRRRYATIFGR